MTTTGHDPVESKTSDEAATESVAMAMDEAKTENDLPGPLHLSFHCDGIDVEIHVTASKRRSAGSIIDHLFDSAMAHIKACPSSSKESLPPSIIDYVRAQLEDGALSIEDMASMSSVLVVEDDRRRRRAARATSPSQTIADMFEDYLDIERISIADYELSRLIDLLLVAQREAKIARGEATS